MYGHIPIAKRTLCAMGDMLIFNFAFNMVLVYTLLLESQVFSFVIQNGNRFEDFEMFGFFSLDLLQHYAKEAHHQDSGRSKVPNTEAAHVP